MGAKDWLTLLTSWAAIIIAGYSLWVTWRRDRRERAATEPLFHLHIKCPANPDYATGELAIESRQEEPIIIEDLRIRRPRDARFIENLASKTWKLSISIPINVRVTKEGIKGVHFFISPKKAPGDRFVFDVTVRILGRREHVRQFRIKRTAE
jgi:hypothetical protein